MFTLLLKFSIHFSPGLPPCFVTELTLSGEANLFFRGRTLFGRYSLAFQELAKIRPESAAKNVPAEYSAIFSAFCVCSSVNFTNSLHEEDG
ncbi:MAG: hypothetical protein LBP78_00140 [Acidaminococcales bacterium]|jgi:hypothetical protein|nr:hypothetical protein [Acidaminococcales bacterium]